MPIRTGAGLAKAFGAEQIFRDVSFEIQERDRIALVGPNGSGKSTLLRIIGGLERADAGTLALASGVAVGYLPQEVSFPPGLTLHDYMLGAFDRLLEIEGELRRVETALGSAESGRGPAGDGSLEALLDHHSHLLHEYEYGGGYSYESRIREVLAGLGIEEHRLEQRLESFSGGQRTRVALAHLLLSGHTGQDLLLLDEPTNHLDLEATEWLEGYLAQARPAVIVVSHDRYFLDKVAARTWELIGGRLEAYTGNYTQFAQQKAERLLRQQREYAAQQEHVARTEAFIRRYKAGQRSKQARGRQKQLNRLERVARPRDQAPLKLTLQSTLRSGDTVLATEGLVVAAGTPAPPAPPAPRVSPGQPIVWAAPRGRPTGQHAELFRCPDVEIRRGERVAVVGPNGAGKTTFLRVVTGEAEPAAGRVYIGYGIQLAYYAQAHEQLRPERTVIGEIQATQPLGEEEARTYLGRFLFSGDDVFKGVASLSGGERSRLALAKMALGNANFLVLDEPTNHLDLDARAALEEVLAAFPGTILFVSHDRYLIDALATHVWEIGGGHLTATSGGWSELVAQRQRRAVPRPASGGVSPAVARGLGGDGRAAPAGPVARQRTKALAAERERLARLEGEIADWQERLTDLGAQLEAASAAGDATQIADLGRKHVEATEALARCEEDWVALSEALEDARLPELT